MAPLNAVNLIIGPETLLVIDDVERCDMGIRELLGAVDHLVVGCRKKVLLVCNEDEWRKGLGPKGEKGTTREYESLIEKTVWRKCGSGPRSARLWNAFWEACWAASTQARSRTPFRRLKEANRRTCDPSARCAPCWSG